MSDETTSAESGSSREAASGASAQTPAAPGPAPSQPGLVPLPGLAAIAFYLLLLAGTIIVGVVAGGRYPPAFLVFSALFIAASGGLFLLFRWAWALALAAVALLAAYNLWIFSHRRDPAALVQGLLNLVFFLYLVRTEVRARLR